MVRTGVGFFYDRFQGNRVFDFVRNPPLGIEPVLNFGYAAQIDPSSLTSLPIPPRISPVEAVRIITNNILARFDVVTVGKKDYLEALNMIAAGGWVGAKIYDALLVCCAGKSGADRIGTFDLGDFRQLAPLSLQEKLCAP